MRIIKKLKIIGTIAMIISFVFIVRTFIKMDIDLSAISSGYQIIIIFLLASVMMLNLFLSSYSWKIIVEFFENKKVAFLPIMDVYSKSNIAKYLPGNVFQFAGRNVLGKTLEISQFSITAATILEIMFLFGTGLLIVVVFFINSLSRVIKLISEREIYRNTFFAVLAIGIILAALVFILIKKKPMYIEITKRIISKEFIFIFIKLLVLYSLGFLIMGCVYYVVFKIILDTTLSFGVVISAAIISWVVGFAVPGAPGGMGIREAVMLLLLGSFASRDMVALGAVVFRLISIIGDVLSFVVDLFIIKIRKRRIERE